MKNGKTFYVTTPIYYVNAAPHVGSFYTTLAADILARYYRAKLGRENVYFQTGTDEHGQKIAEYAEKAGKEPKDFVDSVVPEFKKAWELGDIDYDFFFRTTDPRHAEKVSEIFQKIYDAGYIYKGTYEGLYCVGCEKFITESDMVNGRCPLHPDKDLIEQKEENYFFKLSEFAPKLIDAIERNQYIIAPEKRKNEILNRLQGGVEDVSISRESISWGIPIPWDPKHTFYVWVEALFDYWTGPKFLDKGQFWPPNVQLLGKDILWFHAVIWEALLLAAELPLPKLIFAHGFFTLNGQKISKSLGNTISPEEIVESYGSDGARYLLMSAFSFGNDGDLSRDSFNEKYTADLVHGLGNLLARSAKLAEGLDAPISSIDVLDYSEGVSADYEALAFDQALIKVWDLIRDTDKYLNEKEPWKIKDDPARKAKIMEPVLRNIAQIGYDIQPVLPKIAELILEKFVGSVVTPADKPYFEKLR